MKNYINPILKLTENCNYSCEFCRYAMNNDKNNIMSLEDSKYILEQCVEHNIANNVNAISIILHGGEPLLWGYQNFKSFMHYENQLRKKYPELVINNSIQTNGYLLNDQFIDLFVENEFNIGISLDGPPIINSHKNKDINCEKVVLENIKKLQTKKAKYGVLSVITNNHKDQTKSFYKFFVENRINSIGLCYCFTGNNKTSISLDILIEFMKELFNLYFFDLEENIRIREFDSVIRKILLGECDACSFANRENCRTYMSFTPNMNVYFCDAYEKEKYSLGNLNKMSLSEIETSGLFKNHVNNAKLFFEEKCRSCEVQNLCGGGCYRHDIQNDNYFCPLYKEIYPYIKNTVEEHYKA